MSGYNANVVTLTVGSELSGEIATYSEASLSDAAGDVVTAAGGAAADSSGNVIAGKEVAAPMQLAMWSPVLRRLPPMPKEMSSLAVKRPLLLEMATRRP